MFILILENFYAPRIQYNYDTKYNIYIIYTFKFQCEASLMDTSRRNSLYCMSSNIEKSAIRNNCKTTNFLVRKHLNINHRANREA